MDIIPRGKDGYYHPSCEEQLQALVQYAYEHTIPLRVRGSAHSFKPAIYTNGYEGNGDPPPNVIEVMLDKYRSVVITPDPHDPTHATVEVEAGCNLGFNPYDPTHTSTWENSLDEKLQKAGYALEDTGGITHQTISGFMSTGSSGGSLTYSFDRNLVRFRFIDGTGKPWDVSRDDPDPVKREMFFAAGVSMGLLGVISKVYLRVGPTFNIYGTQTTTPTDKSGIDLFGAGNGDPSLEDFFRNTPYTRLMWWPQLGLDRMSVWQAARAKPTHGFKPQPYEEMGRAPQLEALAGSLFYTIIGNLGDISKVPDKLDHWYQHLEGTLAGDPDPNACPALRLADPPKKYTVRQVLDRLAAPLATAIANLHAAVPEAVNDAKLLMPAGVLAAPEGVGLPQWLAKLITDGIEALLQRTLDTPTAQKIASWLQKYMPWLIKDVLAIFITEYTQYFWDSWRCGLPMDNQMDDQLWDTEFTELWIPVEQSAAVMTALKNFYAAGGDPVLAYQRTGAFSCEIYAATESPFWMSPSYGGAVIRIDVFWFGLNAGSPDAQFYPQFWELLKGFRYRPHWGKHLPPPGDYLANVPRLKDFLALRANLDPKGIFLTKYWQTALGIERSGKAA